MLKSRNPTTVDWINLCFWETETSLFYSFDYVYSLTAVLWFVRWLMERDNLRYENSFMADKRWQLKRQTYDKLNNSVHRFHRHIHRARNTQSRSFDIGHCRTWAGSIGCRVQSQSSSVFGRSLWSPRSIRKDAAAHRSHLDMKWLHCKTHTPADTRPIDREKCSPGIASTCENRNFLRLRRRDIESFHHKAPPSRRIFHFVGIWRPAVDIARWHLLLWSLRMSILHRIHPKKR